SIKNAFSVAGSITLEDVPEGVVERIDRPRTRRKSIEEIEAEAEFAESMSQFDDDMGIDDLGEDPTLGFDDAMDDSFLLDEGLEDLGVFEFDEDFSRVFKETFDVRTLMNRYLADFENFIPTSVDDAVLTSLNLIKPFKSDIELLARLT